MNMSSLLTRVQTCITRRNSPQVGKTFTFEIHLNMKSTEKINRLASIIGLGTAPEIYHANAGVGVVVS